MSGRPKRAQKCRHSCETVCPKATDHEEYFHAKCNTMCKGWTGNGEGLCGLQFVYTNGAPTRKSTRLMAQAKQDHVKQFSTAPEIKSKSKTKQRKQPTQKKQHKQPPQNQHKQPPQKKQRKQPSKKPRSEARERKKKKHAKTAKPESKSETPAVWNRKSLPIPDRVTEDMLRIELKKRKANCEGSRRRLVSRLSECLQDESGKEQKRIEISLITDDETEPPKKKSRTSRSEEQTRLQSLSPRSASSFSSDESSEDDDSDYTDEFVKSPKQSPSPSRSTGSSSGSPDGFPSSEPPKRSSFYNSSSESSEDDKSDFGESTSDKENQKQNLWNKQQIIDSLCESETFQKLRPKFNGLTKHDWDCMSESLLLDKFQVKFLSQRLRILARIEEMKGETAQSQTRKFAHRKVRKVPLPKMKLLQTASKSAGVNSSGNFETPAKRVRNSGNISSSSSSSSSSSLAQTPKSGKAESVDLFMTPKRRSSDDLNARLVSKAPLTTPRRKNRVKITPRKAKKIQRLMVSDSDESDGFESDLNSDDEYAGDDYDPFKFFHGAPGKTSANTLDKMDLMGQKELQKFIRTINDPNQKYLKHTLEKNLLEKKYEKQFPEWYLQLRAGFNLLFYGIGSKKMLVQKFVRKMCKNGPIITINGYFPSLTIKQIMTTIKNVLLPVNPNLRISSRDILSQVSSIVKYLNSSENMTEHLYIVLHNIDGLPLQTFQTQSMLSHLASAKPIHFIASVDHIHAPLLWDLRRLERFGWSWQHVTNFRPYKYETSLDTPVVGGGRDNRARGIGFVLRSLTPNHRDILIVLAEQQVEEEKKDGISFQQYLNLCMDSMLVTSDVAFRNHLNEMTDHELIEVKRASDGNQYYVIPYPNYTIRQQILQGD